MTFQPTFRILTVSIALALAGATHAQTPAAPSTAPAPAATPAPAPDAAGKAGATTPASKDRATRRATTTPPTGKATAPTGTPGMAAVPGTAPAGGTQGAKSQRTERRSNEGGNRQLQNAYADLMTPEEMAAHRAKVKQTKTYAECKALFESTGKDMEARAKAQNKTVKANPTEICDKAKERGRLTG